MISGDTFNYLKKVRLCVTCCMVALLLPTSLFAESSAILDNPFKDLTNPIDDLSNGLSPGAGPATLGGDGSGESVPAKNSQIEKYYTDIIDNEFVRRPHKDISSDNVWAKSHDNPSMIHFNEKNPCTGDRCTKDGSGNGYVIPGGKRVPLAALSPSARTMFQAALKDNTIFSDEFLASQRGMQLTALYSSETATAQAAAENAKIAAMEVANTGIIGSYALTMAKSIDGYEPFLRGYIWCIQSNMKFGLTYAQKRCSVEATKGKDEKPPTDALNGFTFEYDPAYSKADKTKSAEWTQGFGKTKVGIVDMIRSEEGDFAAGDFARTFGNVTYEFAMEDGAPVGVYKVIDAKSKPSAEMRQIISKRWNAFEEMLHHYCTKYVLFGSMKDTELLKHLKTLSVAGFFLNKTSIQPFLDRVSSDLTSSVDPSMGYEVRKCDFVDPKTPFAEDIKPGTAVPVHKQLFTMMLDYTRLTALIEYLTKAELMEQQVKHLSLGTSHSELRENALRLIYRATGTDEIREARMEALGQLHDFMAGQFKKKAAEGDKENGMRGFGGGDSKVGGLNNTQ